MLLVCIGMIRSGSTLQYNLASELVETVGKGRREGFYAWDEWPSVQKKFIKWCADSDWHVIKVHDLFMYSELPEQRVKYIYIYRDYLGVANSAKKIWGKDVAETVKQIDSSLDARNALLHDSRALIQTYENLNNDVLAALTTIANHTGVSTDKHLLNSVIQKTSRSEAQRQLNNPLNKVRYLLLSVARRYGFTKSLGAFLKMARVPDRLYYILRRQSQPHSKKTLYHKNHISSINGSALSNQEIEYLKKHYE